MSIVYWVPVQILIVGNVSLMIYHMIYRLLKPAETSTKCSFENPCIKIRNSSRKPRSKWVDQGVDQLVTIYCTSTKFQYLSNFTIFTHPEDALNLISVKYYEIDINL